MFKDMLGNELEVGSIIAMPFAKNSLGHLRVGTVTELIPPKDGSKPVKIRVRWEYGTDYYVPKSSMVENFAHSMLLPKDWLDKNED